MLSIQRNFSVLITFFLIEKCKKEEKLNLIREIGRKIVCSKLTKNWTKIEKLEEMIISLNKLVKLIIYLCNKGTP